MDLVGRYLEFLYNIADGSLLVNLEPWLYTIILQFLILFDHDKTSKEVSAKPGT